MSENFGPFVIDRGSGELFNGSVRVHLQDQPFRVLVALLDRPGEVVTRDQLRERLWPDDTFVDFDHALTTAVKKLRRVLNDSATHPATSKLCRNAVIGSSLRSGGRRGTCGSGRNKRVDCRADCRPLKRRSGVGFGQQ